MGKDQYILARDSWENMVACAVEKGHRTGYYWRLEQFAKALVVITVFEKPRQKHDVDNFSIRAVFDRVLR